MPGLLDIAPSTASVTLSSGAAVTTPGVSAKGIALILSRFPIAREFISGKKPEMGFEQICALAPDAVAAFIAAGTGYPGDEQAETIAAGLPIEDQWTLCESIINATMPKGIGPFMERLENLTAAIPDASLGSTQGTKSQPPSNT